ncbi:TRAP transporter substrate-binding protein [Oceanibacterium hippocampi]|uniref:C4-dicarboxylate-binding periplasmic protein n=1 Tax=Oceanibacterium hippocampi TaxID=745714 RepID=A0A1Y5TWR5_9PROT|nr:TRAP transporter substrate-binding protein [Oceanibacterium hippocampi]SLN75345.1 C4-dicarboxylate-binding periplasmic protein precursor [Oceanibacterium hippocampi]
MKRLLAAAILASVTGASPLLAADLPKTAVNVVGNLSITTQSRNLEAPFWQEGVVKASNGAVTANFRPWNEMGLKGPEVFGFLGKGVMNIATAQLGHHSGAAPINDGNDLAGLSKTFDEFKAASVAFFPALSDYYRKELGLHLIALQSYQSQIMYCRDPISGLSDLKGKRIRSSGASQADFINHFGGSGVDVAFGEVQQALEQGVIDCAITGTLGGYTARWHESARHLYTLPINFGSGATVANAAWWDGLDPAVRSFLTEQIEALSEEMWALNRKENEIGINCNTQGPCPLGEPAGMTRVEPSEADFELRREALVNAVLPGWVARCGDVCKTAFNDHLAEVTGLTIQ